MYLGQEPTVGSYDLVTVSEAFNGSRTAFTMSKSVASANQLMIILSGVTQHWGEAFTVSGTTLTFTSAPPTGSTIRILDFGRHVLDVGTPTDGTITTAKLADDAVTAAKLANNAVTAAKLADDAVTIAKLAATGTASGSTFLRGDNAWGTPTDTGRVLQVVQYKTNSSFSTSSTTSVSTGFAQAITPSSASNKVLVIASSGLGVPTNGVIGQTQIFRGSTGLVNVYNSFGSADYECQGFCIMELDSPNTTSATTYALYALRSGASATIYVGARRDGGTPTTTTITLMEIKG